MTRTPRLVTAAFVLAMATAALAGLPWLAPAPERGTAMVDPEITGSLGEHEPPATPGAEPIALSAALEDIATRGTERAPEPAPSAAPGFAAIRDGTSLRLVGAVPDEADRAAILVAARARFVAEPVIDELRVVTDAQPAPLAVAGLALAALARLAEGEARVADNAVALEGRALYAQATQRIEDEMRLRLPEGWIATLRVETPEPAAEPVVAPLPARAAAATTTQTDAAETAVAETAVAEGEPGASRPDAAETETGTADATRSLEDAARPPRPQRAALAEIALHPLPPRR